MPVADSGPTGASAFESRQLSGGSARNLSWLKLPSKTRGQQPLHRGLEAPLVPDAHLHPGLADGGDGLAGLGAAGRQRLLTEHVLAGACGGDDLGRVQLVGRAEHDGVDLRRGQRLGEVGGGAHALGLGPAAGLLAGVHAQHDTQVVALAQVGEDLLAPPPEPDDGNGDHRRSRTPSSSTADWPGT
jgi:hypothetical protein